MAMHMQGWLTKRGAKVLNWKRRWFTLDDKFTLSYWDSDTAAKPIRAIPITAINELVPAASCGVQFPFPDINGCFGIDTKVNTGGRIFFVCSLDVAEAMRWKAQLFAAILRSGDSASRQKAAHGVATLLRTSGSACLDALVESGAIDLIQGVSKQYPACKDLYPTILELIGEANAKSLPPRQSTGSGKSVSFGAVTPFPEPTPVSQFASQVSSSAPAPATVVDPVEFAAGTSLDSSSDDDDVEPVTPGSLQSAPVSIAEEDEGPAPALASSAGDAASAETA
eukprot:m.236071 g.236071  ORF g.236071 m.236071 type:complete len:281 (-) comp12921_c0_seq1:100-942(-)